ncbi:MAG: sigma-70 family RNA polymerase sigma factor [Solirubrobacteraceae bacterium]
MQSDERLVALIRRGNTAAFETLLGRYESRLLSFCRHLLGSAEDAEDVLQEVFAAAFNAIVADDRSLNVRPWLYRIARNRSLNHLRRTRAIGVDSMDVHFSDHGASTADRVHDREEFRLLIGDIHELPETQKTALVLREMDALSYEQIAEAMESTVPSVKSLLVRARVSLAEASAARLLSCEEVRIELGEIAEGLQRRSTPLVRRHLRKCERCAEFRVQLRHNNKALAALMPIGPLVIFKQLAFHHLGHSAGAGSGITAGSGVGAGSGAVATAGSGAAAAGSGAAAAGSGAVIAGSGAVAGSTAVAGSGVLAATPAVTAVAGSTAIAGSTAVAGSSVAGFVSAGVGAVATKAAAGLAAAALLTAGAVEVDHAGGHHVPAAASRHAAGHASTGLRGAGGRGRAGQNQVIRRQHRLTAHLHRTAGTGKDRPAAPALGALKTKSAGANATATGPAASKAASATGALAPVLAGGPIVPKSITQGTVTRPADGKRAVARGRTLVQSDPTVLPPPSVLMHPRALVIRGARQGTPVRPQRRLQAGRPGRTVRTAGPGRAGRTVRAG